MMPVTVGATFGPEWSGGVRPWVEFGAGYYRKESTHEYSADDTDFLPGGDPTSTTVEGVAGGYFGGGVDVPLSGRLTMGTGVRMHGWSDYILDGMIALQTGLAFGF